MRNIIFSEDYSTSFLTDGSLVFQSDFFVCLRGGGMCGFPRMSKKPYLIVAPPSKEIMWAKNRLDSWQRDDQCWIDDTKFSTFEKYFNRLQIAN